MKLTHFAMLTLYAGTLQAGTTPTGVVVAQNPDGTWSNVPIWAVAKQCLTGMEDATLIDIVDEGCVLRPVARPDR